MGGVSEGSPWPGEGPGVLLVLPTSTVHYRSVPDCVLVGWGGPEVGPREWCARDHERPLPCDDGRESDDGGR